VPREWNEHVTPVIHMVLFRVIVRHFEGRCGLGGIQEILLEAFKFKKIVSKFKLETSVKGVFLVTVHFNYFWNFRVFSS
jgi:hypothetical protein